MNLLVSRVNSWNHFHLRDESCPVILLGEIDAHISPIPIDRADHAHTLVCHRAPLVPGQVKEKIS